MARLPDVLDSLTPEAQKVYERIAAKRGRIQGPYAALMHHPALADRVGELGEYLRFGATLPGDVRELAILITARAVAQPYEWVMHLPVALQAGLPEEVIERVRAGGDLGSLPPRYVEMARLVQHALARESIPRPLQDRVQTVLGLDGLLELVALAGFYQMIATVLFSFDVPLPEGTPAPF